MNKKVQFKRRGRKFKMDKHIKILKLKDTIGYCTIPKLSMKTGFSSQTIRDWIKKQRIQAGEYSGIILLKRDTKLPPPNK